MYSAGRWLPWILLLNAALMIAVALRFVELRDGWTAHRIAIDATHASRGR